MEQTTREKILSSGKKMFLEMGFQSAPLRKIVAQAGFTQGAFYGYFKTKEDLFYALTDEFVEKTFILLDMVQEEMEALPAERRLFEMSGCYLRHLPEIVAHFSTYQAEFKLVVGCGEGTKYAGLLDTLAQRNISQLKESLQAFYQLSEAEEKLLTILMKGYFSMLAQIILEQGEEEMLQMMIGVHMVFEQGIIKLFQLSAKGK